MRNRQATNLLFELSHPGRRAAMYPACDVPAKSLTELLPSDQLAEQSPDLPELTEPDVIRHFTNLSTLVALDARVQTADSWLVGCASN